MITNNKDLIAAAHKAMDRADLTDVEISSLLINIQEAVEFLACEVDFGEGSREDWETLKGLYYHFLNIQDLRAYHMSVSQLVTVLGGICLEDADRLQDQLESAVILSPMAREIVEQKVAIQAKVLIGHYAEACGQVNSEYWNS